jgi:hypothetical protein
MKKTGDTKIDNKMLVASILIQPRLDWRNGSQGRMIVPWNFTGLKRVASHYGLKSPTAFSKNLKRLCEDGMARKHRQGKEMIYEPWTNLLFHNGLANSPKGRNLLDEIRLRPRSIEEQLRETSDEWVARALTNHARAFNEAAFMLSRGLVRLPPWLTGSEQITGVASETA